VSEQFEAESNMNPEETSEVEGHPGAGREIGHRRAQLTASSIEVPVKRAIIGLCLILAVAVGVDGAAAAGGGNKTGKLCQKDHYLGYTDPATGQPFLTEQACTSYVAMGGVLQVSPTTGICFDAAWTLIKDQFNGPDGSATSGAPCANFVIGGGSLAGFKTTASGTTASVNYTTEAFSVNALRSFASSTTCSVIAEPPGYVCRASVAAQAGPISSPYSYSDAGTLTCSATGNVLYQTRSATLTFTTLGAHSLSARAVSCVDGTDPRT
jgi:hypothetical protein